MKCLLLVTSIASMVLQVNPIFGQSNKKVEYFLSDPAFNNSRQIEDYFYDESETELNINENTHFCDERQAYETDNYDFVIDPKLPPVIRFPDIPPAPTNYDGEILTTYYNQKEFVEDYYKNLYTNFPSNNVGNCGYVAIALLLQYYDVYWNDSIIDNRFSSGIAYLDELGDKEFISPGVKNIVYNLEGMPTDKNDPKYDEKRASAYRKYILESMNNEESFIGFLYSVGVDLGIIKLNNINIDTGVYYDTEVQLLNGYINTMNLNNVISVKSYKVSDFASRDVFLSNLKDILKSGQPAIVGGGLFGGGGHVTLAYKYDEDSDIIYGHNGWSGKENCYSNFNKLFNEINDYYYLEISSELHHEHNELFSINGENYCNCKLESHECNFQNFYYGDDNYHIRQCICSFTYNSHLNSLHNNRRGTCIYCGHAFGSIFPTIPIGGI